MRIACIHQGYERYGSDRSFAESVATLARHFPGADIEVVLPREGPIISLFAGLPVRLTFEPLWILRRSSLSKLLTAGLATLPAALLRAAKRYRSADLVYVNTSVVLDYALVSRFFPGRTLLHIHEIGEGRAMQVLRFLARFSRAELIFNSKATKAAFGLPRSIPQHVVYNGVPGPAAPYPTTYDGRRPLRLLLLGRVNRIKGQEVLLEAIARLPDALRSRVEARLVGSAFENPDAEKDLEALVETLGLSAVVRTEPFRDDPAELYRWADVVVVPSRRPESLGRVAIEAMANGRPPIASSIGGLTEVVVHGETGWLVPPGDPQALAARLEHILLQPADLSTVVAAGRTRYEQLFAEDVADRLLGQIATAKLAVGANASPKAAQKALGAP